MNKYVFETLLSILLGYIPRGGIVVSYGNSIFNILGPAILFTIAAVPFYISASNVQGSNLSKYLPTSLFCFVLFDGNDPEGYEVISHYGFALHFSNG